jgi:glycosyltransferase involved in cell wall biosynthesis
LSGRLHTAIDRFLPHRYQRSAVLRQRFGERAMPEVSVVIPTYNRAATVERAIQSTLAQTLPPLEVIVVDDASDDRTEERLGMIRSPLLRVIRHAQNRGAAGARNSGIEAARGDCTAFLDADDEWLPNKLSVQLPQLLSAPEHTAVSCTGAMMHLLDHARQLEIHPTDTPDWHRRLLLGCDLSPGTTLLAHRWIFEKVGLFDETLRRFEDWDWLIPIQGTAGSSQSPTCWLIYITGVGAWVTR